MRKDRELTFSRVAMTVLVVWAVTSVVLLCVTVSPITAEIGIFRGSSDFFVYKDAAHHVLQGQRLYEDQMFEYHWWTYTPFAALFFLPLQLLPSGADETGADQYIWMALNLVLLVAVVVRCWQLLGYRATRHVVGVSTLIALGSIWLEPVRTTIFYGQINLVLMVLLLWDFSRDTDSRSKGVGTGFAAGIKLTPAYFVLYYLALRQHRTAAVAAITGAATVAVGFAALPTDSWEYWTHTFFDSSRVDDELDHPANQSIRGALAKITDQTPAFWLWGLLALTVAAASLAIAVRLYRREEKLASITLVGMSGAMVSPFSWSHHWVWFVPVVVYFIHRALTDPRWWVGVFGMSALVGSWPYQFPSEDIPRLGFYLFPPPPFDGGVLINLYVVMFVPLFIWFAWLAFRQAPDPSAPLPR